MKENIGIGAKKPERECSDGKCPWHGSLSVRGRIFIGEVASNKAPKTVVVERGYHRFVPKYERYERRRTKINAYNPPCIDAKLGDAVKIAECRKLSKTKSFVVVEKVGRSLASQLR